MADYPPAGGEGPVGGQGSSDPFSAFDNRIRYNDMARYQMISQYSQNYVMPATMTWQQQAQVGTEPRFQYGVQGGQDTRYIARQSQANYAARNSGMTSFAGDVGIFGAAQIAGTIAGVGMLPVMAASIPASIWFNEGVKNSMIRQQYMHQIATDVEGYRDRLGFNNLTYSGASDLGSNMFASMNRPGQFFSREQQMKIHKIGLSNDLMSSTGGMAGGTTRQYLKNFEELKSTVEDVVKTLNTTLEGGMSVIKELNQTGFSSMRQIKSQIRSAQTIGNVTGLGAQNIMQTGLAGAMSVQGTPWRADVGASMYQMGAANAAIMARGSQSASYAVARAGGIAEAGGVLARAQMNAAMSGIGTKFAAYAMNPDGTVDQGRLNRALSGKASSYEIVSGANATGYAMGANKIRFDFFKEDMYNNMSDAQRGQMFQSKFKAWGGTRYGSYENKAAAFAGLWASDSRERRLIYESLINPNGVGELDTRAKVDDLITRTGAPISTTESRTVFEGGARAFGTVMKKTSKVFSGAAESLMSDFFDPEKIEKRFIDRRESARRFNLDFATDRYGTFNQARFGDIREGLEMAYGFRSVSGDRSAASASLATIGYAGIEAYRIKPSAPKEFNAQALINRVGAANVQNLSSTLTAAMYNGTVSEIAYSSDVLRMMGITSNDFMKMSSNQQAGAVSGVLANLAEAKAAATSELGYAQKNFDTALGKKGGAQAAIDLQDARLRVFMGESTAGLRGEASMLAFAESKVHTWKGFDPTRAAGYNLEGRRAEARGARQNYMKSGEFKALKASLGKDLPQEFNTDEGFAKYLREAEDIELSVKSGKLDGLDDTSRAKIKMKRKIEGGVLGGKAARAMKTQAAVEGAMEQEAGLTSMKEMAQSTLSGKRYKEFESETAAILSGKGDVGAYTKKWESQIYAWGGEGAVHTAKGSKNSAELVQNLSTYARTKKPDDTGAQISQVAGRMLALEAFTSGKAKSITFDGQTEVALDKDTAKWAAKEQASNQTVLNALLAKQAAAKGSGAAGGMQANTAAPVLNYWNNSWSL